MACAGRTLKDPTGRARLFVSRQSERRCSRPAPSSSPVDQAPKKAGNHRALADIQESIEELRYYREAVFVKAPGPSTAELRAIAERHRGAVTGAAAG